MSFTLPKPARYFPLDKGVYEVAPGLRTLGFDFGNGAADGKIFQIDDQFMRYRQNIEDCRRERLGKYYAKKDLSDATRRAVAEHLVRRFVLDQPEYFELSPTPRGYELDCKLTGDCFEFDSDWNLIQQTGDEKKGPLYEDAFDALCSQVQEDVAIQQRREDGTDYLTQIHLCSPSHWAAEEKIGTSFMQIHAPVPHIEKISQAAAAHVNAMIHKGPYVRFVWGFATDTRLNHHPEAPPGWNGSVWKGRSFSLSEPDCKLFVRVERQTTHGLPAANAAVFTVRVSFLDGEWVRTNPKERDLLLSSIQSMTPQSRAYKGLSTSFDDVVQWLKS